MNFITILTKIIKKLPIACYPFKPYMHKHKCIFVHIPKNAGSSIGCLFKDDGSRKHAKWYDFRRSNRIFFEKYHKFCIVREPIDRLYSAYRYCIAGGNQSVEDLALQQQIIGNSHNFESFVNNVLSADFVMQKILFTPQYLYIFDQQLNCKVDTILQYENLTELWEPFAKLNDFPRKLPHINTTVTVDSSEKVEPKTLLSLASKQKIQQLYSLDFSLLNYDPLV